MRSHNGLTDGSIHTHQAPGQPKGREGSWQATAVHVGRRTCHNPPGVVPTLSPRILAQEKQEKAANPWSSRPGVALAEMWPPSWMGVRKTHLAKEQQPKERQGNMGPQCTSPRPDANLGKQTGQCWANWHNERTLDMGYKIATML